MSEWQLQVHGVGNAAAAGTLGSAMASILCDGALWLTIDCGAESLDGLLKSDELPRALFITHAHLDHIGGLERLFFRLWFDESRRGSLPLYCPAELVPVLHQRVGEYPNVLAEGGVNFWEAFRLVPVGRYFWHAGLRLEVFEARHHWPRTAFGLRLPGSLVWTGDTRPIPETLAQVGDQGEVIAHDCGLVGNPSHTGVDDVMREYSATLRARMWLYHYASMADADALRAHGLNVLLPGQTLTLPRPHTPNLEHAR